MSLDDRVRVGLSHYADGLSTEVEHQLRRTQSTFRRRRTRRRAAVVGLLVLVAGVAAPMAIVDRSHHPQTSPSAPLTDQQAHALLQGRWQTGTVTATQVTAALARAGMAVHAATVESEQGYPTAWTLVLGQDTYDVWSRTGVQTDTGSWSVEGSTLTLHPSCPSCEIVLAWRTDGRTLHLGLLGDPSPDLLGAPDAAFAIAMYTTAGFSKVPAAQP